MKKKLISILIMVSVIALVSVATRASSRISNDKITYSSIDGFLTVSYIEPTSNAYKAGIEIGDRILFVNGVDIISKYVLHNLVFDKTPPGDTLRYEIDRNGELLRFKIVAQRRFAISELIPYFIFSIIYILFCTVFYNIFPKTKTTASLYLMFLCFSLITVFFNVPFSNQFLYTSFIIISCSIIFALIRFSQYFLYDFRTKFYYRILTAFLIITDAFWLLTYLRWVNSLNVAHYDMLMTGLRLFQFIVALTVVFSIIRIFVKILKIYTDNPPKEYLIFSFLFLILLVIYPLLYAIPFALRQKELLPFSFFFYLYLFVLMLIVFFRKKLLRVLL